MQFQRLQTWTSTNYISQIIEFLLEKMQDEMEVRQAMNRLPSFLAGMMAKQLYEIVFPLAVKHSGGCGLAEENWNTVPKIAKDTLMPKDISRQKDESERVSPKLSALNLKLASSMSKKVSTTSRTMKSISLTEKRSIKEKKAQNPCQMLQIDLNQEDNQVSRLRQKTELRLKYDFQYNKLILFRQKSFRQKSKILDDLISQQPLVGITHDYEGEQLKSSIIVDDKIKHYSIRAQFGTMMKRKKEEQFNRPIEMSVEINKYSKQKELPNKLVKPMDMPLFPVDHRDFLHQHEIRNYKLHDYKKHFGKKYSRLDQYSQTLQLSNLNKEDHKQQIFSERKHLRDSSMLQVSRETVDVKGRMRRLALPRLHGKYKVLDRYDQA